MESEKETGKTRSLGDPLDPYNRGLVTANVKKQRLEIDSGGGAAQIHIAINEGIAKKEIKPKKGKKSK